MRRATIALFAAALSTGTGLAAAAAPPEEQIAKALDGRVAGEPRDCIQQRDIRSTRIIARTAILYEMNNGTIYLNRPESGEAFLRSGLTLVTNTHSSQLCSIDIVRLYDAPAQFESGSIGLGAFVPYVKPARVRPS